MGFKQRSDVVQVTRIIASSPGNVLAYYKSQKFVSQSRTGLQIYEGHDDQFNYSIDRDQWLNVTSEPRDRI
jgi:hypothetical protein